MVVQYRKHRVFVKKAEEEEEDNPSLCVGN